MKKGEDLTDDLEIEEISLEELPAGKGKSPKKKSKFPRWLFIAILVVAAGVFIFAAVKIITILSAYKTAQNTYSNIGKLFTEDGDKASGEGETETIAPFVWDYDALLAVNGDAKGYIRNGDFLNYPIVQCSDNSTYLTTLIDGTWNDSGTLFVDARLPEGMESKNCIVYGHNMNDGSMFGRLKYYAYDYYFQQNPEMDVYIGYKHYIYKVYSAYTTPVDGVCYQMTFSGDEDFLNFANATAAAGNYETGVTVEADDYVMTLSTCVDNGDDNYRFVVLMVRDREVTE